MVMSWVTCYIGFSEPGMTGKEQHDVVHDSIYFQPFLDDSLFLCGDPRSVLFKIACLW